MDTPGKAESKKRPYLNNCIRCKTIVSCERYFSHETCTVELRIHFSNDPYENMWNR